GPHRPGARGSGPSRQRAEGHREDRAGPEARRAQHVDGAGAEIGDDDAETEIQARAAETRPSDGNGPVAPSSRVQEPYPDQEASEAETAPAQAGAGLARRRTAPQAPVDGVRSDSCPASRATSRA